MPMVVFGLAMNVVPNVAVVDINSAAAKLVPWNNIGIIYEPVKDRYRHT
jgi:hypothetical protein